VLTLEYATVGPLAAAAAGGVALAAFAGAEPAAVLPAVLDAHLLDVRALPLHVLSRQPGAAPGSATAPAGLRLLLMLVMVSNGTPAPPPAPAAAAAGSDTGWGMMLPLGRLSSWKVMVSPTAAGCTW
jgi:hypothetical protein